MEHWPINTIEQLLLTTSGIQIAFTGNQEINLDLPNFVDVSQILSNLSGLEIKRPDSYTLMAGSDDESHIGVEVVPIQLQIPPVPVRASKSNDSSPTSPFSRRGERRKAFRRKPQNLLSSEDSVEVLSELMDTDFSTCQPAWNNEQGSSPVYDSVASARVDRTLKLSNLTYTALSQTLKWTKQAQKTNNRGGMVISRPPPLPPKPKRLTRVSRDETNSEVTEDQTAELSQRLGAYILPSLPTSTPNSPAVTTVADYGQRSRIVHPHEALKVKNMISLL